MVTIVSGCPGAGKTTLARYLATAQPDGLHLATDPFYDALPNLIDPASPAAKEQNENIVRSFCCVASSFEDDGQNVELDGVVGPWMLPIVKSQLFSFYYLILQPTLETAINRVGQRIEQPVPKSVIIKMHGQFARQSEARHIISEEAAVEELAKIFERNKLMFLL